MNEVQPVSAPSALNRPTIPDDELRQRPEALGQALAQAGFDGWIAFGDDRAVAGPDHVRYLSDFAPHFEPVVLAARCGESGVALLTGPESIGYASVVTARSAVTQIVAIDELVHPDEEYPTIEMSSGLDTLRDVFAGVRRIAVLGAGGIPSRLWQRLIAPLLHDGREGAGADELAYGVRAIKSDAEQAVIDEAYRIARIGLEAAARAIRPGAVEREIAGEVEAVMRLAGAEGFGIDTMVASGVANTAPILARSTFRTIGVDDLVTVTLAPRYEGYHAALARAFLFGPHPEAEYAIEVARRGQDAALEQFVVGEAGRDAAQALREVLEGAGTGAELPYVPVHSTGLIEFEPPIFLSSSDAQIQDGMALSIDAALFHAPWGGLRLEDGFAIRGGQAEPRFPDWQEMVPVTL
jgi:Xaa-Pro aminopeptidase